MEVILIKTESNANDAKPCAIELNNSSKCEQITAENVAIGTIQNKDFDQNSVVGAFSYKNGNLIEIKYVTKNKIKNSEIFFNQTNNFLSGFFIEYNTSI